MLRGMAVLVLCSASFAAIACDYPLPEPQLPDGKTATKEQMVSAQQAVKEYVAKIDAYIACLDQELAAAGEAVTEAEKHIQVEKHNAAVDAEESLADRFNVEVRAYKGAQGGS